MTDSEFEAFVDNALDELEEKQHLLDAGYRLVDAGRWWFEQSTGKLQFFDHNDLLSSEADVMHIGSYSPKSNTWNWAWGNASVLPWLREKAEKLKELEVITSIELFSYENPFTVESESMAWELAAMSIQHLQAKGCYKTTSSNKDDPSSFLAIFNIKKIE